MNKLTAQIWFSALSQSDKVIVLINVMHQLTIAVRSIFLDHAHDCETRSRLAYDISQLNHRLTSAAWSMMERRETYPDAVIVEMLFEPPNHPELEPYIPYVFEQAVQYLNGRTGTKSLS